MYQATDRLPQCVNRTGDRPTRRAEWGTRVAMVKVAKVRGGRSSSSSSRRAERVVADSSCSTLPPQKTAFRPKARHGVSSRTCPTWVDAGSRLISRHPYGI